MKYQLIVFLLGLVITPLSLASSGATDEVQKTYLTYVQSPADFVHLKPVSNGLSEFSHRLMASPCLPESNGPCQPDSVQPPVIHNSANKQPELFWQNSNVTIPRLEALDIQALPPLKDISLVVSGGSHQPYSAMIRQNHLAWAHSRQVEYVSYEYHNDEEASAEIQLIQQQMGEKINYWIKIPMLMQQLERKDIPENSWIVWIDDDIVINDFHPDISMLDQAVSLYGGEKSLLIAQDKYSSSPFNAGIFLVRKDDNGRAIIRELWKLSDHPVIGYKPQPDSFHEQEVLSIIYKNESISWTDPDSSETFYLDYGDGYFSNMIGVMPNRNGHFNFNTFICQNNQYKENVCSSSALPGTTAVRNRDAFLHHAGLGDKKNSEIITTLTAISDNYPLQADAQIKQLKIYLGISSDGYEPDFYRNLRLLSSIDQADSTDSVQHFARAMSAELPEQQVTKALQQMHKIFPLSEQKLKAYEEANELEIPVLNALYSQLKKNPDILLTSAFKTDTSLFLELVRNIEAPPQQTVAELMLQDHQKLAMLWHELPEDLQDSFDSQQMRQLIPMIPMPRDQSHHIKEKLSGQIKKLYQHEDFYNRFFGSTPGYSKQGASPIECAEVLYVPELDMLLTNCRFPLNEERSAHMRGISIIPQVSQCGQFRAHYSEMLCDY